VRRARRVIAVSQATADDLTRFFGTAQDKIDVVPSGPGVEPVPATPEAELRERLGLRGPVVLSPSARRPHKNLRRLVEAMDGLGATLVLPGYETGTAVTGDNVVVTGWLEQADLEGLYALARCLVFPSLAEGFGLPVLEAMRRGVPVACSDATALAEVAGDAALVFDPHDTGAIRAAVRSLLADDALAADLAERGPRRADGFSWERAAQGTVAAYRKAL
jgi:alpha-1,3-rhamnosyl/mannosyltransferase